MNSIIMTKAQTAIYDSDAESCDESMRDLRAMAMKRATKLQRPVDIYTADGIMVDQICPDEQS